MFRKYIFYTLMKEMHFNEYLIFNNSNTQIIRLLYDNVQDYNVQFIKENI